MKKNVIKRIVSLTLVALLILTLFAGCKAEPVKTAVEKELLSSAKQEKARESALTQSGVKNATFSESEYDREDGVYEFEFVSNGMEYDYEVDAITGKVVKAESEAVDDDDREDSRYLDRIDDDDDDNYDHDSRYVDRFDDD